MTDRFTRRFRVRHYELDATGRVGGVVLVRYMQEAAIEASTALGFSPDWYQEHGTAWVVRRLSVRYFAPVGYGEEVAVATWLSTLRGVRSIREYDVTRSRDGARVARGRAEWVYIDVRTAQPIRFPDAWSEAFPRPATAEDLGIRLVDARPTANAHRYTSRRTVQFHDLDAAQHVNHAMYLQWAEQARLDALRAAGHPPERGQREGWSVLQAGREVQYFAPALDNDNIEIVSWLHETAGDGWAWTQEICHADTRKLLVREYSVGTFVDAEGKSIAPPQQAIEDVLRGPAK